VTLSARAADPPLQVGGTILATARGPWWCTGPCFPVCERPALRLHSWLQGARARWRPEFGVNRRAWFRLHGQVRRWL
jgi:hypothetical protein